MITVLTGCQNGDPAICTPITDPLSPTSIEQAEQQNRDPVWVRLRAEACVHRNAYRIAGSPDEADVVARAVIEACSSAIDQSVAMTRSEGVLILGEMDPAARLAEGDAIEERARRSWQSLALLKVVEGRAGRCKPE